MTKAMALCELAWGDQQGFVGISMRRPDIDKTQPGYWTDKMYQWPEDRKAIAKVLEAAETSKRDVYWAPAVFNSRSRSGSSVTTLSSLWADLDEVSPDAIPKQFTPTAIWESSPGRYQALWKLKTPIDAKQHEELNQKLTYALGADKGGWDLAQVLRIPGTHNHKYPDEPEVKLLHLNGHRIDPTQALDDLPDIILAPDDHVELPPRLQTLGKHQSTFNERTRHLLNAKHASVGERSDRLWELECLLAERGLSGPEIVTIVRGTVWNKFRERRDEVRRLLIEAEKALLHAGPTDDVLQVLDQGQESIAPIPWSSFDRTHKPITWLVADIWGANEVGFISGLPKSYKSWFALDLAVSVATGTRFLSTFQARKENVLLIQEEDPKPVLQDRLVKIAAAKGLIDVQRVGNELEILYDLPDNLHIISNQGFALTEDWLEQAERWIIEREIKLAILDPLMMIAGSGFDEFKAFDFMAKVLKPLKRLRAKTQCAITLVHHHLKSSSAGGARDMYGSVALWAWEESALHLQMSTPGKVTAERFSKHALLAPLTVEIGDVSDVWAPRVAMGAETITVLDTLRTMETGGTAEELMGVTGWARDVVMRQLKSAEQTGEAVRAGTQPGGSSGGRPRIVWRAT